MTRRRALGAAVGFVSLLQADCAESDAHVCSGVLKKENDYDLTILWVGDKMALAKDVRFSTRAFRSDQAGRVSVSPDGQFIVWARKVAFESAGNPLISFSGVERLVGTVMLPDYFPIDFATSNGGRRMLVLAQILRENRRVLLNFDSKPGGAGEDLTDLFSDVQLAAVERISTCGTGAYSAISTDGDVIVLDVSRKSVVFKSRGRGASISPAGDRVAYLDTGGGIAVRELAGGRSVRVLTSVRILGIAAWSPDGELLLAGVEQLKWPPQRLVALDVSRNIFCELGILQEGDDGVRSCWIARHLASI